MEILVEKILLARQDSPLYKHLAPFFFLSLIGVLRGEGLRKNYSYLYIPISYIIVKLYPGFCPTIQAYLTVYECTVLR